jgi:hypothetical protein
VVVTLSWSIASLTRGFSGLSSDTPRSDQAATKRSYRMKNAQSTDQMITTGLRAVAWSESCARRGKGGWWKRDSVRAV